MPDKNLFKLEKKIRYYNANLIIYVDMNKSNKMPLRNFEMKTWKHAQVFIIIKYADEYENFHFFFQIMYSEDKTEIAKYDINN